MIPRGLLPDALDQTAFIAGGFAACPALAEDVDVWVPAVPGECEAMRTLILAHLRAHNFDVTEQDGEGSPRRRFQQDTALAKSQLLSTFEGYHMVLRLRRVGTVTISGHTLPYHIIVVEGDIDEVLSSFDISTHQIALTARGVVKGVDWTPLWEPPLVLADKYTTPDRVRKIRTRYQIQEPTPYDTSTLCTQTI